MIARLQIKRKQQKKTKIVFRKSQDDTKKSKKDNKTSKPSDEQESALEERDTLDTFVSDTSVSSVSDSDGNDVQEIVVVKKQKAATTKPIENPAAIAKSKPAAPEPPVVATTSTSDKSKRKSAIPKKKILHLTNALKDIKRIHSMTQCLIPRLPVLFLRLVKETIQKRTGGTEFALKDIKRIQSMSQCLISREPFLRLVKETIQNRTDGTEFRVTETAVDALRETSENLLTKLLEESYLLSLHAVSSFVASSKLSPHRRSFLNKKILNCYKGKAIQSQQRFFRLLKAKRLIKYSPWKMTAAISHQLDIKDSITEVETLFSLKDVALSVAEISPKESNLDKNKNDENAKKCLCHTCDKVFAKNHHLVDNMRVHSQEKPFKCNLLRHFR
jgi:histone H3/H4